MRVGFVGLGLMGAPMAMHLIRAGLEVAVYNRSPGKAAPHGEAGAAVCASPAELAGRSQVVLICVSDTEAVESVLFSPEGVAGALEPGGLIVDHSTISPTATREFAARLAGSGISFVDAPVTGGTKGALEGKLVAMAGGKSDDLERARPVLEHYAPTVVHVGPVGQGQLIKLCNNLVGSLHVLAMAEGFHFAGVLGLDLKLTHQVIASGAAGSFIWENWGGRLVEGDLSPGFKIALHHKDIRLVLDECRRVGLELPGLQLVAGMYEKALALGLGELGDQALVRVLEQRSGK
ncbi:MAG: NAD(P)-dependent oxidoreductase [Candidatus Glassbacteria bacterium]|nr:NAD(P)-dependent oxidoreductase [Candidatus Glassbacteria bacterium]